eukprot:gene2092-2410_t
MLRLQTRSADEGCRAMVLQTLDAIQATGFTVVRIWAFNDGPGWMSLQPKAGQLEERVLVGLDWLIVEAGKRGLRLMMTLTNYWKDFGGMPQYVRCGAAAWLEQGKARWQWAQDLFRNFVQAIVTRNNSISGTPYSSDPVIHSWDIANEPRCEGQVTSDRVSAWIEATAAFVKSLDSSHPVTVGLEGFFGPSTPGLMSANPYNAQHGVDWVRDCSSTSIDFASIHMYVDQWCRCGSDADACRWCADWVLSHVKACQAHLGNKPLVLQEFGKKPGGPGRKAMLQQLYQLMTEDLNCKGTLQGCMLWLFAHESYPDYDGYTMYASGAPGAAAAREAAQPVVDDMGSVTVLRAMCQAAGAAGTSS